MSGLYRQPSQPKLEQRRLQWNPVNPITNGPQQFGRINGVAVLKLTDGKRHNVHY